MATTITPATKAMTWMLLNSQPFFASLVMRMEVREATDKDPECPVAYTDGARIIYNSEAFAAMPEPERAGVPAHAHCCTTCVARGVTPSAGTSPRTMPSTSSCMTPA